MKNLTRKNIFNQVENLARLLKNLRTRKKKSLNSIDRQYGLWMNFKFMRIRIMIFFFFFLEDGFGCGQLFGYFLGRGW